MFFFAGAMALSRFGTSMDERVLWPCLSMNVISALLRIHAIRSWLLNGIRRLTARKGTRIPTDWSLEAERFARFEESSLLVFCCVTHACVQ